MLPAAAHLDRFAPPDAGRAVEVEKIAAAIAGGLLNHEMPVEHDCLQARQQIVGTVDVGPAHLGATHNWVGEVVDQLAQKIRLRHKVGVKNRNQISLRGLHPVLKRAGFEAGAVVAMDVMNVETLRRVSFNCSARDAHRLVRGIVEHLNLQTIARIVDLSYRLDQTLDDVHFVEERKLHGDVRQLTFRECAFRTGWKFAIAPEIGDLLDAINSIDRQNSQDREVNDQNGPIEAIELIQRADVFNGLVIPIAIAG